ncbi:MAG TPA: CbbBc protein, partial [Pseudomonas sp.]|nr:CbbBc protein [Pseudomonas sp.]
DWQWLVADYDRIRALIADTIAGFADFNQRMRQPGGFYLGNSAARREWATANGRANFKANLLPDSLIDERVRNSGQVPDLVLQSMRSHDQYNTTIYGLDDRYRGVRGQRDVLFANEADIVRLGFEPGQKVDIVSLWGDEHVRRVRGFTLLAFDIPAGQAAAYYPEVNPLVPLESIGEGSHTPTSKFIAIKLERAEDDGRIL